MILLTAITPSGPRLAIKTSAGVVILEAAQGKKASLPLTIEEALFVAGGLDRVRNFVGDASTLSKQASPEDKIKLGPLFRPRNVLCIGLNYKDHAAEPIDR